MMWLRWLISLLESIGQRASRLAINSLRQACRKGMLSGVIVFGNMPGVKISNLLVKRRSRILLPGIE